MFIIFKFFCLNFFALNYPFAQFKIWVNSTFTAHFFYVFLKFIAIPFLVFTIAYLIALLLLNRYYFDKLKIKKKNFEAEINDFLTTLIFSDYSFEQRKLKVEAFKNTPIFKDKWCKYLILDKLIDIKRSIKSLNKNLIIYKQLELDKYSHKLIKKRRWYYKSLAFYHYQSLDYKIKKSRIQPYLESKNKYLQSNALIAHIALSDQKFDFLKNYTDKISIADEMKILDLIYHKKSEIPDKINSWLENNNPSVVILGIKLIVRHRANIPITTIDHLLLHPDTAVRKEIITAIGELVIFDANKKLINHYKKEVNVRNKISILKTLAIIGNNTTLEFVTKLLAHEKNMEIKFQIIKCNHQIDDTYFDNFTTVCQTENQLIQKMILHVKNPYLN